MKFISEKVLYIGLVIRIIMRFKFFVTLVVLIVFSFMFSLTTAQKINLPDCPFQDSPGIWAKPKDCDWNTRVKLGTGNRAECKPWWSLFQPHTTWDWSLSTPGRSITTAPAGVGEATEFCKIEPVALESLPSCPFSGNVGDVYVKPKFWSGFFEWTWDKGRCKIGEECSQKNSFDLKPVLLALGLITEQDIMQGATVEIEVGKLIKALTGINLNIDAKIKIDLKAPTHFIIGPELYTHSGKSTAWCGTEIPPILTGALACDICVIRGGTSNVCSDSDGGRNYFIKGTTTFIGNNYEDFCVGSNQVLEYYCEKDTLRYELYNCSSGCINGACLGQISTTSTIPGLWRCIDSDNGQNKYVQGTVRLFRPDGSLAREVSDYCVGIAVVEMFCTSGSGDNENIASFTLMNCDAGQVCINGACVSGPTTIPTTIPGTTTTSSTTIPIQGSCAGRCQRYEPGAPCQCDPQCRQHNDC
jgi:hypothetical protein